MTRIVSTPRFGWPAAAAVFGFPREKALAAMTLEPAKVLGVADRLGSLEAGKDATLFLADNDILARASWRPGWTAARLTSPTRREDRAGGWRRLSRP